MYGITVRNVLCLQSVRVNPRRHLYKRHAGPHEAGPPLAISCPALATPFDLLRLERMAGTDRAKRMVASDKPLFMFV